MSDTNDHSALPDDELLAAEYALGVLTGTDRAAAQRLLERDRNFARMVAAWEQRLAPWAGEIAEVSPPPQVWEAIAAALPAAAAPSAGLWQSLAFWRGFALASALAAACLGVFIYLGAVNREQAFDRDHRRRRQPRLHRHHRCQARHRIASCRPPIAPTPRGCPSCG